MPSSIESDLVCHLPTWPGAERDVRHACVRRVGRAQGLERLAGGVQDLRVVAELARRRADEAVRDSWSYASTGSSIGGFTPV